MNYKELIEKEGNYKEWIYTAQNDTFYKCHIKRNPHHLFLCGYVDITTDNKLFGLDYSEINFTVHGGLTYFHQEDDICVYGFDCGHFSDMMFNTDFLKTRNGVYRNMDFVINECQFLAEQFSGFSISVERNLKIEEVLLSNKSRY